MCNIWKVLLLVTVHLILLKLFSIDLLIFFGMFLILREMIFRFMIFNTLTMTVALLTNQAVFDNISLMKIEAHCMLALFLRFYFLPPPPRF